MSVTAGRPSDQKLPVIPAMKLLLALSLCVAAVVCEDGVSFGSDKQQSDVGFRHGSAFPDGDRYYPYPGPGPVYPYPDTGNPFVRPSGCKNWCRRDNFYPGGRQQYYCCDRSGPIIHPRPPYPYPYPQPYPYPGNRQKVCPASPPVCLRQFSAAVPPTECYSNRECATTDLCCYDVCLKHKTCKTADYVEDSRPPFIPGRRPGRRPSGGGGLLGDLVGSLFARSNFQDEPHSVLADEPARAAGIATTSEGDAQPATKAI